MRKMETYERRWWWVKEKKQVALVLITITMMLQLQMKACVGCVETERTGLLQLKSYLSSFLSPRDESILESWSDDDRSSDCCHWERVNCSEASGGNVVDLSLDWLMPRYLSPWALNLSLLHSFPRLQSLNLAWNNLNHMFEPIHGYKSFQKLEKLDLSNNFLSNSVYPFLSEARSLRTLNLAGNTLEGGFPPSGLMNLTELEELNLRYNSINLYNLDAGDGYKSFQRLKKLRTLDLFGNGHNNSVLPFLSAVRSLRTLNLGFNKLKGVLNMNVLKDMPNLQELDLSSNEFTDLDSLGILLPSSLQVLDLGSNQFSWTPKGYSEICRLLYLQHLDLNDNDLTSLPCCVGNLTRLRELKLNENALTSLPCCLGNLTHLRELSLRGNALTSLPYCLSNLSRLRTLDLSGNQLSESGEVSYALPSALEYLSLLDNNFNGSFLFNSLVNKTRLTVFRLSSKVGMIQALPETSWVPLFQLKMLELHNFNFGSTIPGFLIHHQRDLRIINLGNNKLTGPFPTWLMQNYTRLQMLFLNDNSLTNLQLPRLAHGLEVLNISNNRISGSIQEDIGKIFPNLTYMHFASNHFQGGIPSSISEMKSLRFLDMSSNSLYGQLPETFLSSFHSLIILNLSNNQLEGEVLPDHANLTGLHMLLLGGNNFKGSLGKGLLKSKSLILLDVSDNCISDVLPLWIGTMSRLGFLYMRGNQLKGTFPHQQLQNLALEVLDVSHNRFSGSIPRNFNFSSLRELRLQSNEFMGFIPDTLFNAKQLELLDLRNNNLSGMILNTIGKNSTLRVLLLGNNSFRSHIPKKICQLSGLGLLDLSYNKFQGVIPSCLCNMFSGEENPKNIRITYSYVVIMVDPFIPNWKYTTSIFYDGEFYKLESRQQPRSIVDFLTKGRYEAYQGDIIGDLYGLDLSNNQLSGEIPIEIGNLLNIYSLNFSSNQLTGSIPDSISKLKDLGSLDLSNNKLDGKIPPQLADLNTLGVFNVSYNNLSGEVPTNGHLLTFDEKSYVGNAHLCGLPTKKICNPTTPSEPSASNHAKEEEEESDGGVIDIAWFYWSCGAVYISTLLSLCAFLCIDSRWSQEWFYRVDLVIYHLQRFKLRFVSN